MRIKKNPMTFASSEDFKHVIIIPNTEENINLTILIKNPNSSLTKDNLHSKVREALNNI